MKKKMLMIAFVAVGLSACAQLPAPIDEIVEPEAPAETTVEPWYEACLENGGPGVVQVKYENVLDCDMRPPQRLTVVIDERTYVRLAPLGTTEGWGGDASLAWADQALADSGCTVVWHEGQWAEGTNCDY